MTDVLPRIVTRRELLQIIPFTPQYILRLEKQGKFPRRIPIGARRVGWRLSEIETWIAEKEAQRTPNADNAETAIK